MAILLCDLCYDSSRELCNKVSKTVDNSHYEIWQGCICKNEKIHLNHLTTNKNYGIAVKQKYINYITSENKVCLILMNSCLLALISNRLNY